MYYVGPTNLKQGTFTNVNRGASLKNTRRAWFLRHHRRRLHSASFAEPSPSMHASPTAGVQRLLTDYRWRRRWIGRELQWRPRWLSPPPYASKRPALWTHWCFFLRLAVAVLMLIVTTMAAKWKLAKEKSIWLSRPFAPSGPPLLQRSPSVHVCEDSARLWGPHGPDGLFLLRIGYSIHQVMDLSIILPYKLCKFTSDVLFFYF